MATNSSAFSHAALSLGDGRSLVYTAMSKHFFYFRAHISKYVLEHGKVPLNPFMLFDYFLLDSVNRDVVREANNSLVLRAEEVWVFGPISNGVLAEITLAKRGGKPISYFRIENNMTIIPVLDDAVEMEQEVAQFQCNCSKS